MVIRARFAHWGWILAVGAGCSWSSDGIPSNGQGGGGGASTASTDVTSSSSSSTTSDTATSSTGSSSTTSSTGPTTDGTSGQTGPGTGGASTSGAGGSGGAGGTTQQDAGAGGSTTLLDASPPSVDAGPSTLTGKQGLWDLPGILRIRGTASSGALKPAYDQLVTQAEAAMALGPFSVMDKTTTPPSGDKHDYTGLARYFWPDPTKPNGLPYISKDGESNPDVDTNKYDYHAMFTMSGAVTTLGLAYFFTRNEKYAQKAHDLVKVWYIDAATKMNPNLNYAQSVPGLATGRKEGVIDTLQMTFMIDSLEMLRDSSSFTPADFTAIEAWFTGFVTWLRTSPFGTGEEAATNNHGSWYDVQTMRYAIFLKNTTLATQLANLAKTRRISTQVNPDGSQPQEIARTKSLFYSEYNMTALFGIGQLATAVGVDVFGFQSADLRSVRKAFDFLAPYADPAKVWPYPQIELDDRSMLVPLLRRASVAYSAPAYEQALETNYAAVLPTNIIQLVYPK